MKTKYTQLGPIQKLGAKAIGKNKFLATFANQVATYKPGGKQHNELCPFLVEHELSSALANGETLTLSLPAPYDKDYVPVAMVCWSAAAPSLPVSLPFTATALNMTSHNRTTGVTVFTAGAAGVADNSVLSVLYVPATLGS